MNQTQTNRIEVVDALRGLALCAIVIVHCFEHYNLYYIPESAPQWLTALDREVWNTTWFLLAGKAFSTFSLLFGFSFFIVFKILASLGALITGQIGLEAAGGTITVITTIAEVSASGFGSFLYVMAIISANLAVMNLLPLPALDGSRMVFTLIEMIFRKPVPRKVEAVIHAVGLILLVLLAVFLDVFHLVRG